MSANIPRTPFPALANASAPTNSEGQPAQLSVDLQGRLRTIVTGGASGGTSAVDDGAFTVASDSGTPIMGLADETAPDSVDEGDVGVVRMTLARGLHINVRDDAGDSCMDGANNALRCNIVAGSGSGYLGQADESAFTEGTTTFSVSGGVLNDTITSDPTEDSASAVRITAKRAFHVNLRNVSGTEIGTLAAPVRTDPTGTTAQPVTDNGGALTVDNGGTFAVQVSAAIPAGNNNIGDVDVASIAAGDNNIGNVDIVTVPAPLSTTGGGTEAAALRVTVANDSTGVLSVDDNGGSLTVDGTVSVTGAVDTELTTADLDTGAGTDTRAVVGLVGSASGGGQLIPGSATDGLLVNLGANNDVTLGAAIPAGTNNIGDVDVLSVPAPLNVTGGGTEAAALRVTIASDSTGVLSIDDNAGSITVDGTVTVTDGLDVEGTIADDATTPGKPVLIGGVAKEQDGTDPGSVSAEDDVARCITDRNRRLFVNDAHPNLWSAFEDHTTAQTNNSLKAAPGANLSLYITDVVVSNGATAGNIKLVEDTGGTPVQIGQTIYMAVNGGAVINWKTPKKLTANKDLGFTSTTVTTHSIEVHGFIAP